jgi:hypothetical protein
VAVNEYRTHSDVKLNVELVKALKPSNILKEIEPDPFAYTDMVYVAFAVGVSAFHIYPSPLE